MRGLHQEHISNTERQQVGELLQQSDDDRGNRQHQYWLALWDAYLALPMEERFEEKRLKLLQQIRREKCA